MKKETIHNLQCDWNGICDWYGIGEEGKREIIKAVVEEVDSYRNRNWYERLLNKIPKWDPFK